MVELAAQLRIEADIDLSALFGDLAGEVVGVDFGDVRFEASAVLDLVAGARGPDVEGLRLSVGGVAGKAAARLDLGLPGVTLPDAVTALTARLGSLQTLLPDVPVPEEIGLDALGLRLETVREAVRVGPLADLLGLVPGVGWSTAIDRVGAGLGGLLGLLRILSGLAATATTSRLVRERSAHLTAMLDLDTALAAGTELARRSADAGLATALRDADPTDLPQVDLLVRETVAFADAVLRVGDTWSAGMGFGEAALLGLDLTGSATALDIARLAMEGADATAVAALAAQVHELGRPLLELALPERPAGAGALIDDALELVVSLADGVRAWDVAQVVSPLTSSAAYIVEPLTAVEQAVTAVGTEIVSALRGLRAVVDEIDLTPVVTAVRTALQPVVDVLDAVEDGIAVAEDTLAEVCDAVTTALGQVSTLVGTAASRVTGALEAVRDALALLHLEDLAAALTSALTSVASTLATAALTPYFDGAIDAIDTGADVIEAVPFGLLPTDVQQEIVDVCEPIKELDLQGVEDALRAELEEIRGTFRADALAAIEAAYADVVAFLASLDPGPHLEALERDALGQLRAMLDEIDPAALLAPVEAAMDEIRGLLAPLDLQRDVIAPLADLFTPILEAIDEVDPSALLAPAVAQVDRVRDELTGALHLEEATAALETFRATAADVLGRVDARDLAEVLDEGVSRALTELPAGPPGGAFGSLLVTIAQASGLRADETAIGDVLTWVAGSAVGGDVVRERLRAGADDLASVAASVRALDPAPLATAAEAQRRALRSALDAQPADSALRLALDPVLDRLHPADLLGPLADNRRRYLITLDAAVTASADLAAGGRAEVTEAAGRLRAALSPLGAFPARLRALLTALGFDAESRSFGEVLRDLLEQAAPGRLVPALATLVDAVREQLLVLVDAVLAPAHDALGAVAGALAALDLAPVVDELTALHGEVRAEVAQLSPELLLGGVVTAAQEVIDRLEAFDPLAPVREMVDAALAAADAVFESARPTVVFAPVALIHGQVVRIAGGLDVVALLGPILDALDGIALQLDDGFDRTGDSLQRLQAALPSEVSDTDLGVSVGVDLGVSF